MLFGLLLRALFAGMILLPAPTMGAVNTTPAGCILRIASDIANTISCCRNVPPPRLSAVSQTALGSRARPIVIVIMMDAAVPLTA